MGTNNRLADSCVDLEAGFSIFPRNFLRRMPDSLALTTGTPLLLVLQK